MTRTIKHNKTKKHNNLKPKLSSRRFFFMYFNADIIFHGQVCGKHRHLTNLDQLCDKLQVAEQFSWQMGMFLQRYTWFHSFQQSKWARIMHANEMHVTSCILRHPEGGAMCFSGRSTT